ncbi:DNA primase [Streptomyces sp. NPDC004230]
MNRTALGLAIGAGYVLGRTKKMKLAFAVASLVAGKRMQLSPRAVADLLNQQLLNNPQFKEIGDQLRQDLRGVGKAASGALVERQMEGIADRLHDRTSQVRDELSGAVPEKPDLPGLGDEDEKDRAEDESGESGERAERDAPSRAEPEKKAAGRQGPAKKAPAKQAPGSKAAAKKAPGKKAPAKKTAAAKGGARSATRGSRGEGRR